MAMMPPGFDHFPTLQTGRLSLRAVTDADATAYRTLLADAEVTAFTDIPDAPTVKQTQRLITWMIALFSKRKGCAWAIEYQDTLIGAIRINRIHKKERCGIIGYELSNTHWGQGIMTEALTEVVGQGHTTFDLNRLEAWTSPGNPGSDKVLLKCGFQYEGTLRQKSHFKGKFQDLRMFGRLQADER
ncbi:MAG: GNAT family protein [Deinococcota bacterium]